MWTNMAHHSERQRLWHRSPVRSISERLRQPLAGQILWQMMRDMPLPSHGPEHQCNLRVNSLKSRLKGKIQGWESLKLEPLLSMTVAVIYLQDQLSSGSKRGWTLLRCHVHQGPMRSSWGPWISSSLPLTCRTFHDFEWMWTCYNLIGWQPKESQHQPVNSLKNIFRWKAKSLFILILPLPAQWRRRITVCAQPLAWGRWKPLTWRRPPSCSTAGRCFGTGRWSCRKETWHCLWPGKDWPRQCCCTKLF